MPVHFLASAVSAKVPTEHWASIAASLVAISFLKTWSKGVKLLDPPPPPSPETLFNDLHGRVVLVSSGAFTPLGVVTISALAHRGAQIIALTHDISSPDVIQMVHLIRDSTQSELIYAEQCDIASLESISAFAALWNAGDKKQQEGVRRLDSLLFLPPSRDELSRVGQGNINVKSRTESIYELHVLSKFHLVNSLLSSLLVLPPDREIRIVSVMSPFYAAGLNHFDLLASSSSSSSSSSESKKPLHLETTQTLAEKSYSALIGAASLRWYALTTELQRRVDLLAEADPRSRTKLPGIDVDSVSHLAPKPPTTSGALDLEKEARKKMRQHSNISIINVCPGFERDTDIMSTFLPPAMPPARAHLWFSLRYYILVVLRVMLVVVVWPVVWLLSKSPATASDAVVWATTRKLEPLSSRYARILTAGQRESISTGLIPGEMYREAQIVRPLLPRRFYPSPPTEQSQPKNKTKHKTKTPNTAAYQQAWQDLWKHEETAVETRLKQSGGKIKRPKI